MDVTRLTDMTNSEVVYHLEKSTDVSLVAYVCKDERPRSVPISKDFGIELMMHYPVNTPVNAHVYVTNDTCHVYIGEIRDGI